MWKMPGKQDSAQGAMSTAHCPARLAQSLSGAVCHSYFEDAMRRSLMSALRAPRFCGQ